MNSLLSLYTVYIMHPSEIITDGVGWMVGILLTHFIFIVNTHLISHYLAVGKIFDFENMTL